MTAPRSPLHGRKLGDRRVVVDRPHSAYFRYAGAGVMVAKAAASAPRTALGRRIARIRSIVFGKPLTNAQDIEERLSKKLALPIFSSDAISSSAYATDEILKVLVLASVIALSWSIWVAAAIALMLTIVAFSYRQVCRAYPSGGGAYVVARENLGARFGLIAAAALMVDYVMTVAVSSASALANLGTAFPAIDTSKVLLGAIVIVAVTAANLRGIRESGNIFAVPTYMFVGLALLVVGWGIVNVVTGSAHELPAPNHVISSEGQMVTVFLLLKAFAGGSVALTGVEAIANGVPAFKPPEAKNAANTLIMMAVLLGVIFIGLTFVGLHYGVRATDAQGATVLGQVGQAVFGNTILFYLLQISAALILFLACNTSFNAFPRLAAILAKDGYMPRQFAFRGDRLAFSWGIVVLAAVAIGMLFVFKADTHALIPLYSVGVFICFTLSQTGMVIHWRKERSSGWAWRSLVNGFGAILTGVVFIVVATEKFADGAWMVLLFIPLLISMMLFVSHQYVASARQLEMSASAAVPQPHRHNRVIVPIPGVNRAVVQALNVARSITTDIRAVYISDDPQKSDDVRQRWAQAVPDVPLVLVESPYRALVAPLIAYLDVLDRTWPDEKEAPITFVIIPEYVARSWWERLLYNQASKQLRATLLGRSHTVVINVPYRRDDASARAVSEEIRPAGTLVATDDSRDR
ncbi:MAG TPA: APC family permease [Candidatus Limnocylindrales bacterium]|nr:APC family permease [Candidatus Limnocylindrales bacterium]